MTQQTYVNGIIKENESIQKARLKKSKHMDKCKHQQTYSERGEKSI